ncbi:YbjN domain-containing protein [Serinibacter salmoneus]|uniref:Putative sensory transduction regulator n=1 Tax=Serinibacter salmoneus TaxID=556530 RepID=A0A2A9D0J7_9MICO|nr:YbjN domain-containing protein [Serinibacter salmoneus]PFG19360.1 putative sensory transduction regulator [Serinibacter salmoneus]
MNGDPTRAITLEHVRAVASARGEYVRDEPDGVKGQVEGHAYRIAVTPTDLVVSTRWSRTLPASAGAALAHLVNDWNRDRAIPTLAVVRSHDSEQTGVTVRAHMAIPIAEGMTTTQLDEHVEIAVEVTRTALRALASSVPAP